MHCRASTNEFNSRREKIQRNCGMTIGSSLILDELLLQMIKHTTGKKKDLAQILVSIGVHIEIHY